MFKYEGKVDDVDIVDVECVGINDKDGEGDKGVELIGMLSDVFYLQSELKKVFEFNEILSSKFKVVLRKKRIKFDLKEEEIFSEMKVEFERF